MEDLHPIEGDYVETSEGTIFAVRGHLHPPRGVIAFPRYIFEEKKPKQLKTLSDSYRFIHHKHPEYLHFDEYLMQNVVIVPLKDVARAYSAMGSLPEIDSRSDGVSKKASSLTRRILDTSGIPTSSLGITGSLLLGTQTSESDIDLVVYGRKNCQAAYNSLAQLREARETKPISGPALKHVTESRRDTIASPNEWARYEQRKVLNGIYEDTPYSIKLVLKHDEADERYGDRKYLPLGLAEISATVEHDSEAIFTPCTYKISEAEVLRGPKDTHNVTTIASFRSRFAEQARKTERILCRGRIEEIRSERESGKTRLLVGNFAEDFLKVV